MDVAPSDLSRVTFSSSDSAVATVSPTTASSTTQTLTITGIAKGTTKINALYDGAPAATLRITVKNPKAFTVNFHTIRDSTGREGAPPFSPGQYIAALNGVYNEQANISFSQGIDEIAFFADKDFGPVVSSVDLGVIFAGISPPANTLSLCFAWDLEKTDFSAKNSPAQVIGLAITNSRKGAVDNASHINTAAHELGHSMGLPHLMRRLKDKRFLMHEQGPISAVKLTKAEVDRINPD